MYISPLPLHAHPSGLEQCKAREEDAGKEAAEGEAAAEALNTSKDLLIKRRVSSVSMGQAISVVGGYGVKSQPEDADEPQVALVKRLPEPILPSTQTK